MPGANQLLISASPVPRRRMHHLIKRLDPTEARRTIRTTSDARANAPTTIGGIGQHRTGRIFPKSWLNSPRLSRSLIELRVNWTDFYEDLLELALPLEYFTLQNSLSVIGLLSHCGDLNFHFSSIICNSLSIHSAIIPRHVCVLSCTTYVQVANQ